MIAADLPLLDIFFSIVEIHKLADLRARGALSDGEFETKKAVLLR